MTGKSTQLRAIVAAARQRGIAVESVAFPFADTATAPLIERFKAGELRLHHDPARQTLVGQALFSLNRVEAAERLRALIGANDLVVASRYADSGRAYAVAGGVPLEEVRALHAALEDGLPEPHLVAVLDLDPVGLTSRPREHGLDAFDRDTALQERVRGAYAAMAAQDARLRLVDASGTAAAVTGRLLALLEEEEILPLVP
jgi:thymidylate kinase